MPPRLCQLCHTSRALVKRPKTGQQVCKTCFFHLFETEVHNTITTGGNDGGPIFKRGEKVAIGASGGKDSTVLAHVMTVLNERYDYGLELFLLSIDEGITGYRDDSLEVGVPSLLKSIELSRWKWLNAFFPNPSIRPSNKINANTLFPSSFSPILPSTATPWTKSSHKSVERTTVLSVVFSEDKRWIEVQDNWV